MIDLNSGGAVPEIMPPVTQTQGRIVPPVTTTSAKPHVLDVKGSDFVPRMTIVQSNAPSHHISKPKRYSTQRQRPAADADMTGDLSYDVPPSTDMTPAQPLVADRTYYGTHSEVFDCSFII